MVKRRIEVAVKRREWRDRAEIDQVVMTVLRNPSAITGSTRSVRNGDRPSRTVVD